MRQACIDVGGTFTDCVVQDERGALRIFKSSTTPQRPVDGVVEVLRKAAAGFDEELDDFLPRLGLLVHGTTLATNVLLTRRGAVTGFVTTAGFREVLPMRRGIKNRNRSMFDQFRAPYRPLIDRARVLGVTERMNYRGEVRTPLDEAEVTAAATELAAAGCTSIGIGFLHSYVNPVHETRAKELIETAAPGVHVVASYEVLPAWREFERFSTTAVSAYVGPTVQAYLRELETTLRDAGLAAPLLMMLASGLMQSIEDCADKGVHLITSGPAAAPFAARFVADLHDRRDVLEVDMGGTSFDLCLIQDGRIPTTGDSWVGEERVAIKMVDVGTIGAGGGSIVWADSLGLVRIGPASAGADPGPAAYGHGEEATLTDADLVLGYIDPEYFLGGEMTLDRGRAERALARVGAEAGLDAFATARTAFDTATAVMADSVTEICTRKGHDVRSLTLVAGGGAGGLHAAPIAARLGMTTVAIPQLSAAMSAFGMLTMSPGQEHSRTRVAAAADLRPAAVERTFAELEAEAAASFDHVGLGEASIESRRSADMRYLGQFHELSIEVQDGDLEGDDLAPLVERFHRTHEHLYGYALDWRAVELLAYHVRSTVPRPMPLELAAGEPARESAEAARRGERSCLVGEGRRDVPVYDGSRLAPEHEFAGPALVDSQTTTVLVPAGFTCRVDAHRNLILEVQG